MTRSLFEAYAVDINDRMRDNGYKDLRALVDVQDITLPAIPGFRSPNTTPALRWSRSPCIKTTAFE